MEDFKKRMIEDHNGDPTSHWIQILDSNSENGDPVVVAAANWNIFDSNEVNPHAKDSYEPFEKYVGWWPEGSEKRKFTAKMFETSLEIMRKRQMRPHLGNYAFNSLLIQRTKTSFKKLTFSFQALNLCFTHPNFRRRGAAAMMVQWGIKKADELGLECFLTSTPLGTPVYQKAQYIIVDSVDLHSAMSIPEPSDEWEEYRGRISGLTW